MRYLLFACGSLLLSFIATSIFEIVYGILFSGTRRKKALRDHTYNTVIATEVTKYAERHDDGHYHLLYKFEVDGKTYRRFVELTKDNMPTLPLYYLKNPRAATNQINKLGHFEYTKSLYWCLTGAIFAICCTVAHFFL